MKTRYKVLIVLAIVLGILVAAGMVALAILSMDEPPPIRQSLVKHFPRTLAGWTGEHEALEKSIETALGTDEYLNLQLQLPDGRRGMVFVTYNANAWSNIPHVPWVYMVNAEFKRTRWIGERDIPIEKFPGGPGKKIKVNVLLLEPQAGVEAPPALMLLYFNVGGEYTPNRELALWLGTSGNSTQQGSYLSQIEVAVWLAPGETGDPMVSDCKAYHLAVELLNEIVPILEKEYYPRPEISGE
jgi:hypothetical protein